VVCVQGSQVAEEMQALGFAVRRPALVAALCTPHWCAVHALITAAPPDFLPPGGPLFEQAATLHDILAISDEFFKAPPSTMTDSFVPGGPGSTTPEPRAPSTRAPTEEVAVPAPASLEEEGTSLPDAAPHCSIADVFKMVSTPPPAVQAAEALAVAPAPPGLATPQPHIESFGLEAAPLDWHALATATASDSSSPRAPFAALSTTAPIAATLCHFVAKATAQHDVGAAKVIVEAAGSQVAHVAPTPQGVCASQTLHSERCARPPQEEVPAPLPAEQGAVKAPTCSWFHPEPTLDLPLSDPGLADSPSTPFLRGLECPPPAPPTASAPELPAAPPGYSQDVQSPAIGPEAIFWRALLPAPNLSPPATQDRHRCRGSKDAIKPIDLDEMERLMNCEAPASATRHSANAADKEWQGCLRICSDRSSSWGSTQNATSLYESSECPLSSCSSLRAHSVRAPLSWPSPKASVLESADQAAVRMPPHERQGGRIALDNMSSGEVSPPRWLLPSTGCPLPPTCPRPLEGKPLQRQHAPAGPVSWPEAAAESTETQQCTWTTPRGAQYPPMPLVQRKAGKEEEEEGGMSLCKDRRGQSVCLD
jgi:hypothetical protein